MAKFYRRLFFWIFFFLFLITTPLAIYYSQGYRFDNYRKVFIHSGSITIKSTPASVNVYLNGELQSQRALDIINNSITINGLRPGNYDLRVTADGYEGWEKNVEVHSGVSTEFWNVFLPPQNAGSQKMNASGAFRYFPSPFGKKIAYLKKNQDTLEFWSLDIKSGESKLIASQSDLDYPENPLENIEWNFKERLIISPVVKKEDKDYIIFDTESSQSPTSLMTSTQLSEIDQARWSPSDQKEVYFLAKEKTGGEKNLYRFNVESNTLVTIQAGIKAFDLSSSALYILNLNNIIYKTNLEGGNSKQITIAPISIDENEDHNLRLIAYDDDRQALISENGKFFIHNNSEEDVIKKVSDSVKSVQFSDDGKKIIFWGENDISVLYLRKWEVQPYREENQIDQIVRLSTPLKNIFWFRDYEHIFFSTQNQVKLVELDSRDHRSIVDILKLNSENFISSYDSTNGIFYFLDQVGDENNLFYFYLPQQTGFFGG